MLVSTAQLLLSGRSTKSPEQDNISGAYYFSALFVRGTKGNHTDPAPLLRSRTQDLPPFKVTGMDFTGALHVYQDSHDEVKAYICLFTCATTRPIHLGVVTD